MKKRVLAVVMSMVFTMGMISGCGSAAAPAASSAAPSSGEAAEASAAPASVAASTEAASTEAASTEASSEAASTTAASTEAAAANLTSPAVGVLMDGAMHTYTVKFPGIIVTFSLDDNTKSDLADGVQVGKAYTFTFDASSVTDDTSVRPVTLQEVDDSDVQPKLSPEVLDPICQAVLAFHQEDLTGLSECVTYPVYVGIDGGVTVKSAEEFQKLDAGKVFTDNLINEVNAADFTKLEAVEAGVVVGDNGHTIIFSKDGQGITGINP